MTNATYRLEVAFDENVAGVFTVDGSALDGTDGLTDVGLFSGTFDDVSSDAQDPYRVVVGTDNLMSQTQPGNLTVTVSRVDNPSFWNPNNPASPLNSNVPGFIPMRPVKLIATLSGVDYSLFKGFLRHATWNSTTRACELYAEDMLLWASRVYPTIASTGTITVGALITLLWSFVDPTVTPICDVGITLDDFSADGTRSVTDLMTDVLTVDLGTVYVNGNGVPVYEQHDTALTRAPAATIAVTSQASEEQSGIDLDDIFTRASVEKTDPVTGNIVSTWSALADPVFEHRLGRADFPPISSPYVQDGGALASELVTQGLEGKQPLQLTVANIDDTTLLLMLQSPPLTVFTVTDAFGGSTGNGIVQQISQTISVGLHQAEYLMKSRPQTAFTVSGSALDGTDGLRYP